MVDGAVKKVTISLETELVAFADDLARTQHTTRSGIIAALLAERRDRQRDAAAREGYRFYSSEASEFDAESGAAVAEAWDDDSPAW
jgi:metal-responsive CopG/Arc/MetJ family transcriptional regulator